MINERTVERIGFKVINTDFIQKLILMYNYFNILISYSIAKGKLAFPNLRDIKTFEAQLNDLIKHKKYLEELNDKLKKNLANS
jgi:hypothetical protein